MVCTTERLDVCLHFLKRNQKILICLPEMMPLCSDICNAVRARGAEPVVPQDLRWISMVQLLFSKHISAVIGFPQVILGLSKLAAVHTPLYIRNAVLIGTPEWEWTKNDIESGLDCHVELCFSGAENASSDSVFFEMVRTLLSWSSVLDCCVIRGDCGNELELLSVPGKKLPALPSFAKQVIRQWEPGADIPFCLRPDGKFSVFP